MGFKISLCSLLVFAMPMAAVAEGCAFLDLECSFKTPKDSAKKVSMKCAYTPGQLQLYPGVMSQCTPCKDKVMEWQKDLPEAADKAVVADNSLKASNGKGLTSTTGKVDNALSSFKGANANASSSNKTEQARSKNASDISNKFKKCSDEINKTCNKVHLTNDDSKNAQAMIKACDDAAGGAGKVAEETKKSGDSLGDMSKLMDTAGKALGAAAQLAQMMQQQQQPQQSAGSVTDPYATSGGSGATSPTPNSTNGSENSSTGASGGGSGVAPSTVGFGISPNGNGVGTSAAGGGTGSTSAGSSSSPYRDPASSSSSPLGSGGSSGAVGASGGGSGGGTSGGGSSNSSGASRPLDGTAAAAEAAGNNYEVSGGGGRAMVGLKPSKGDMDAVSDGATVPPALDPAKLDDLAGKAADVNAASDDTLAHDAESIFLRVRQKYSLLKGAGRI